MRRCILAIACLCPPLICALSYCAPDGLLAEEAATLDIQQLIERLDGPEFAQRQEASQKLSEAGRSAFPALEKAAEGGSREVAMRAVEILRSHFESGDQETRDAAQAALARLSKCGNASAAQRAGEALAPPPAPQPLPVFGGINGLPIRVAGAQIQLNNLRALPGARRIHIRNVNGDREIEIEEGDKKTKIKAPAQGKIEVEITEKVNGKETTRKIEAKDLDELKKKDAAAAQAYERYAGKGGPIQINAQGGIQINARAAGGAAPVPAPVPNRNAIKESIQQIDAMIERYKALLPNNPGIQGTIDNLERAKERIKTALPAENVEKPLK